MMIRRLLVAALFVSAFVASQPASAAENWPESVDLFATQLRRTIGTTDMDGYLAVIKDPKGALLVDVRDANEFKAGHVPGAINVPLARLERQIWKPLGYPAKVDMSRRIYSRYFCRQATQRYWFH